MRFLAFTLGAFIASGIPPVHASTAFFVLFVFITLCIAYWARAAHIQLPIITQLAVRSRAFRMALPSPAISSPLARFWISPVLSSRPGLTVSSMRLITRLGIPSSYFSLRNRFEN